jgi:PAS domain S-box-containing protein
MTGGWRNWVVLSSAAVAGIALSVVVWRHLEETEDHIVRGQFALDAAAVFHAIDREFATAQETVRAIDAFFRASNTINRDEFEKFTDLLKQGHPEIDSFVWAERKDGGYSVTYAMPADTIATGTAFAVAPLDAPPAIAGPDGLPLESLSPAEERIVVFARTGSKTQPDGIVAARILVPELRRESLRGFLNDNIELCLMDVTTSKHVELAGSLADTDLEKVHLIEFAGRRIEVTARVGSDYTGLRSTDAPLGVLVSLLAATALAVSYGWILKTRNAKVALLVEARTRTIREVTRLQRAILESANYAIISFDPKGQILTFNPAAERMLGYRAAEVIGRLSPTEFHDPEDLAFRAQAAGQEPGLGVIVALAGRGDAVGWRYLRSDGTKIPVSLSVSALHEESGEIVGYLAIVHDIAARLAAESELREAKSAAEEASLTKSRFLANMSHELRTPLTAILGYSEMLEEDAKASEQNDTAEDLHRIHDAGRHLLRLIDDVLDLSKVEAGRMTLHPETIDVAALVEDVATTVRPLAQSHGNKLAVRSDACTIEADPTRLKQVLFNLLANAARFTEDGEVAIDAKRDAKGVLFRVRDTGIGMTEEQLQTIFEPFVQADATSTRRYGGTGLGLAIARQFTELMGGSLTARSEPGAGSEFRIRFPSGVS